MVAHRKILASSLAVALGIAGVVTLSACSPQQMVQDAVENAVEDATGGDVNIDVGGGGAVSMPEDFPSAVPVISGDLSSAISLGSGTDQGWTIVVKVADAGAGYQEAKSKLEGAGFSTTADMTTDGSYTGVFDNGTYSVMVFAEDGADGPVVAYTVTQTMQ